MTVTDQDTRADILEALGHVNATAKTEARRGHAGTRSKRYEALHDELNWLLTQLEATR